MNQPHERPEEVSWGQVSECEGKLDGRHLHWKQSHVHVRNDDAGHQVSLWIMEKKDFFSTAALLQTTGRPERPNWYKVDLARISRRMSTFCG